MTRTDAMEWFMNHSDEQIITWFNDEIVDPYGDYNWSTIEELNTENIRTKFSVIDPDIVLSICKRTDGIDWDKKYFQITDKIITFDTIVELFQNDMFTEEGFPG